MAKKKKTKEEKRAEQLERRRQEQLLEQAYDKAAQERPWDVEDFIEAAKQFLDEEAEKMTKQVKMKVMKRIVQTFYPGDVLLDVSYSAGDQPWDHSGELVDSLTVQPFSRIFELLEARTGQKEATFCSGYGWHYPNYGEKFDFEIQSKFFLLLQHKIMKWIALEYPVETQAYLECEHIYNPHYSLKDLEWEMEFYENVTPNQCEIFSDCWSDALFCRRWTLEKLTSYYHDL